MHDSEDERHHESDESDEWKRVENETRRRSGRREDRGAGTMGSNKGTADLTNGRRKEQGFGKIPGSPIHQTFLRIRSIRQIRGAFALSVLLSLFHHSKDGPGCSCAVP